MPALRADQRKAGRSSAIAKVKIAAKDLGLDEDTYRDLLERVTGERSAAACSDSQLGLVLDEFKRLGWAPRIVQGGKAGARPAGKARSNNAVAGKARAMWISLWNLGAVRDPSDRALESFAKRQLGVERMQWMDQGLSYKLIEALKGIAQREGWDQDLAGVKAAHQVWTLKARLAHAQAKRLGEGFSLSAPSEAVLDATIQAYGVRIREAAGR